MQNCTHDQPLIKLKLLEYSHYSNNETIRIVLRVSHQLCLFSGQDKHLLMGAA